MKKKPIVKDIPNKWTKKSTFNLALVIMLLLTFFIGIRVIPEYLRNRELARYKGRTVGLVLSIKETKTVTQGFYGAKTIVPYYTLDFSYKVNGKEFRNTNNIPNEGRYAKFIHKIYDSDLKKEIVIKYSLTNPNESIIKVE